MHMCCVFQLKVEPSLEPVDFPHDLMSKAKQSRSEKKARKAFAKLGLFLINFLEMLTSWQ
jgi:hypothetical protein